jgi:hypothetical protein
MDKRPSLFDPFCKLHKIWSIVNTHPGVQIHASIGPYMSINGENSFGSNLKFDKNEVKPFGHLVQNGLSNWHCRFMTGGVRWRKLGIFINSMLAYFPGVTWPLRWAKPWRTGSGTAAGWKVRWAGHTDIQSWSGFINFSLKHKFCATLYRCFDTLPTVLSTT